LTCEHAAIEVQNDAIPGLPLRRDEIPGVVRLAWPIALGPVGGAWVAPPNRFVVFADQSIQAGAANPGLAAAQYQLLLWAIGQGSFPDLSIHLPSEYIRRLCGDPLPDEALLWGDGALALQPIAFTDPEDTDVMPGTIIAFGGPVVPTGYLLCDGAVYETVDFPELSAALAGTWDQTRGAAAPAPEQFRVPNLSGLALIGQGDGAANPTTSGRNIGEEDGEEAHVLDVSELAAHNHDLTDPGHVHDADVGDKLLINLPGAKTTQAGVDLDWDQTSSTASATTGISLDDTGADAPHNTMQPYAVVLWCIKT